MKIITEYNPYIIKQYFVDTNNIGKEINNRYYEEILLIKEEQIKKALIDLGWTPPKE